MAKGYNLTVQLNLQGPNNLNGVVNNINKRLNNIQANVNVKLPTSTLRQIAQVNRNLKQTGKSAADAASGMEKFGKAAGLAVKRFGAFTAATAGFYAITRATQQSLEKFVEFDRQLTRIAQVTNSSKQSLNGLTNEITKLSVSLGASSTELASVAVTLSQAGLSARETQRALKALALTTLAPTFSNLNQTVEGSIALMKQFSISTRQLEQALGSINAVAGSFAVEAGDLITAVQRAGGVFASASKGVATGTDALNQFLAVFTSVRATTRESAETIATGLRTIFTRIQRSDTIESLKVFGVTLTDLEGKFVGPYRAIEQLSKGLRSLDPRSLEFSGIVEELGGFRQVGKVIPLIQRFSTAQQALNVAQQGSGSLARDAATGQQALGVQISKVQQQFDALIRSIGQTGEFRQFITLSLDLASALIKVADAIKPVLPALAALGAAKVVGGLGGLAKGFKGGLGFNQGGMVPGSGNFDSVKANLTPGEFVIRKKAVQAIGADNLHRMNKYAYGGPVSFKGITGARQGGRSLATRLAASKSDAYRQGALINSRDNFSQAVNTKPFSSATIGGILKGKKGAAFTIRKLADKNQNVRGAEFENFIQTYVAGAGTRTTGNAPLDFVGPPGEAKFQSGTVPYRDLLSKSLRQRIDSGRFASLRDSQGGAPSESIQSFDNIYASGVNLFKLQGRFNAKAARDAAGLNKKKKTTTSRKPKAAGGPISGQDTVPALLTPGEFVINKGAASRIGSSKLNALNNADKITGYNNGGFVQRFNKGGSSKGGIGSGGALDLFVIQGSVSALSAAMGDATKNTKFTGDVMQSLASSMSAAIVGFQIFKQFKGAGEGRGAKFAKGGAVALGGIVAIDGILKALGNSAKEFDKKLGQTNFDKALDEASKSLETLAKNGNDAAAAAQLDAQISNAVRSSAAINEASTGGRYSLRQGAMDLAAYFTGTGGVTGIASGMGDQYDLAASRVRSRQGITDGFSELMDPEGFAKQVRAEITAIEDASAKRFGATRDILTQRGLQQIDRGASIRDVFKGLSKDAREAIARSDTGVAKRLDAAGGAGTAAGQDIINQEVTKQLQITLGPALADRIARTSQVAAAQLQVALKRVFDDISSGFKSVTARVDANFARAADSLSASLGKVGIRISGARGKNILENNSAFSPELIKRTIGAVTAGTGRSGDRVSQFALASTQIGDSIATIIDNNLRKGGETTAQLGGIRGGLTKMLSGMNLGKDVEQVISKQLNDAFAQATKELGDAADPTELRQKVNEIVEKLPAFTGALDLVKQQFEGVLNAQTRYAAAIDQISQAILQQREYFNRASSIRREGDLALRRGLGENIPIGDIIGNVAATVADQTGGITNIDALANKLGQLQSRRDRVQGRLDEISGLTADAEEQQKLIQEMGNLNVEISNTRQGLETLANSTEIAGAALDRISEIQARAKAQIDFTSGFATSAPEQVAAFERNFAALNNILAGGQLTMQNSFDAQRAMFESAAQGGTPGDVYLAGRQGLASQQQATLGLLSQLKPFLGDSQEFNNQFKTVLTSFLKQRTQGPLGQKLLANVDKMFAQQAGQGAEQKQLIRVYEHAIAKQAQANEALGKTIPVQNSLITANNSLRSAIVGLTQQLAKAPLQMPINRSAGGPVYASKGKLVNMQPKGTDTVPAMLTPGEFVVNAKATKKNRGLLEAINGGGSPSSMGGVAYAYTGGFITKEMTAMYNKAQNVIQAGAEARFAMIFGAYKNAYGMGVQKVVPLTAKRTIKQAVMRENFLATQYAMQYDSLKASMMDEEGNLTSAGENLLNDQKSRRNSAVDEHRSRYGTEHPVILKEQLAARFGPNGTSPDPEKYSVIQNAQSPSQLYTIAKNYGVPVGSKQAQNNLNAYEARKKRAQQKREEQKRREEETKPEKTPTQKVLEDLDKPIQIRPQQPKPTTKPKPKSPGQEVQEEADQNAQEVVEPAGPATKSSQEAKPKPEPPKPKPSSLIKSLRVGIYGPDMQADDVGGLQAKASMAANRAIKARSEAVKALENRNWFSATTDYWLGENFYSDQIKTADKQLDAVRRARSQFSTALNTKNSRDDRIKAYQTAKSILGGKVLMGTTAGPSTEQLQAQEKQIDAGQQVGTDLLLSAAPIPGGALISKAGKPIVKGIAAGGRMALGATRIGAEVTKEVGKKLFTKGGGKLATEAGKQIAKEGTETAVKESTEAIVKQGVETGAERAAAEAGRQEVFRNTLRRGIGETGEQVLKPADITKQVTEGTTDALAKGYIEGLEKSTGQTYEQIANELLFRKTGKQIVKEGTETVAKEGTEAIVKQGVETATPRPIVGSKLTPSGAASTKSTVSSKFTPPGTKRAPAGRPKLTKNQRDYQENIRKRVQSGKAQKFHDMPATQGVGRPHNAQQMTYRKQAQTMDEHFKQLEDFRTYQMGRGGSQGHTTVPGVRGPRTSPQVATKLQNIGTKKLEAQPNRFTVDQEKGIVQIFGKDPSGRRNTILYEIPTTAIKNSKALFESLSQKGIQRFNKGGPVAAYMSAGGLSKGTDTVPAMLTPGEFVVNRDSAKQNRGLLESINGSGKPMSRGGVVYAKNGGSLSLFGGGEIGDLGGGGGGGVDFSGFIAAANTLTPNLALFAEAATAFSNIEFGVLSDAGTRFQGASDAFVLAARNFGAPVTKFDNSIGMFVNQTNQLIAAISNMGQIQGTVNVVGTISFAPIEVNVIGLDQIAGLIPGIENSVLAQVGAALSQDNPGISVNTLSSGGSLV